MNKLKQYYQNWLKKKIIAAQEQKFRYIKEQKYAKALKVHKKQKSLIKKIK